MRFFPHFALREVFVWTLALGVLAALAALFPWELGEKADPFAPAYRDIRPEWYFMFMFQTLKLVPGGEIAGIEYEAIPILVFGLAGALLVAVPFLDRDAGRNGRAFTWIGVVALAVHGRHDLLGLRLAPSGLRRARRRPRSSGSSSGGRAAAARERGQP